MIIKIFTPTKYGVCKITIDKQGYKLYKKYKWTVTKSRSLFYLMRGGGYNKESFHREVLKLNKNRMLEVDHINHDSLDNRLINLRVGTKQLNMANQRPQKIKKSSKFKGVNWSKEKEKWRARLKFNQKEIHLGYFINEIEAAKAYNVRATALFGSWAYLNEVE
jgi:hypothetical protein